MKIIVGNTYTLFVANFMNSVHVTIIVNRVETYRSFVQIEYFINKSGVFCNNIENGKL